MKKENKDVAKGWILKADGDLETVSLILKEGGSYDIACFHAQQAAERFLKAFLNYHGRPFPKTHDIEELLALCGEIEKRFDELAEDTAFLTDYAVQARYDVEFWPGKDEVEAAIAAVNKIRSLAQSALEGI